MGRLGVRPGPAAGRFWRQDVHGHTGLLFAGILLVGIALRFALLGQHSLWVDEAFVVWITRHRWPEILPLLRSGDTLPPLYYLLMKAWTGVAGTGEAVLRVPSAFASALSVGLTYTLMRRISSEPVSLLSAFLVSVSPFQVMAAQEARMYALLGTLTLASTLALVWSVERGGTLRWAVYAVLAGLMTSTHYIGILMLGAHGLWVAGAARKHLLPWLVSMAVLALLCVPWVPALWAQTVQVNSQLQNAGDPELLQRLGDLFGLFAFGGSLFGTGSYFLPGTLRPAAQVFLLLPFLALAWRGMRSGELDPRTRMLLGLSLLVPVIVTFAIARAVHLSLLGYYPRWFSYLFPFFAMSLAGGACDLAERIRGQRDRIFAVFAVGVLLSSTPVLVRYYLDPGFRPFHWRAAAALVQRQVNPADAFLYVGQPAEEAFTYYFREPHPSLVLRPRMDPHPHFTDSAARSLAAVHPRVWLIMTLPFTPQSPLVQRQLFPALGSAFEVMGAREFAGVWVYLLETKQPKPR